MRTLRAFLSCYALAFIALNIGIVLRRRDWTESVYLLFPVVLILMLAVGSWKTKDPLEIAGRWWFRIALWLAVGLNLVTTVALMIDDWDSTSEWWRACLYVGAVLAWSVIAVSVGRALAGGLTAQAGAVWSKRKRIAAISLATTGTVAQLATLFLNISGASRGWEVLLGRAPWITHAYNIGSPVFFGTPIKWITPIFGPTGRAFYAVCVLSALVLVGLMVAKRLERLSGAWAFRAAAGAQIAFCGYVITDIRWNSNELSSYPVLATLATLCWAAGLILAVFAGRQLARRNGARWLVAVWIAFLVPFVIEVAEIVPLILLVDSEGLIVLLAGALLSAAGWLTIIRGDTSTEVLPQQAIAATEAR